EHEHGVVYTKHAGVSLEEATADNVVITDVPTGALLYGTLPTSVGHQLNREILRLRPDVGAVIHVHLDEMIALFASAAVKELRVPRAPRSRTWPPTPSISCTEIRGTCSTPPAIARRSRCSTNASWGPCRRPPCPSARDVHHPHRARMPGFRAVSCDFCAPLPRGALRLMQPPAVCFRPDAPRHPDVDRRRHRRLRPGGRRVRAHASRQG